MRRVLRQIILGVFALSIAVLLPATGLAAERPVAWETVDVTLYSEQGSSVLLISGKLPDSVELPATVRLSAPSGGQLQWAGEILEGPPENDPAVEPTVERAGDVDWYTFTLTQARTGQIEIISPETLRFDGSTYRASVSWAPPIDTDLLRVSVLVPPGANVVSADEGLETVPGPNGFTYLRRTIENPEQGEPVTVKVSYTAAPAASQKPASFGSPTVFLALVALFALVAFVAMIALRNKARSRASADESFPELPIEDAPDDETGDVEPVESEALAETGGESDEYEVDDAPARKRMNPVAVGVVALLLFGGAFAVSMGNRGVTDETGLSMQYGGTDECATTVFALQEPEGRDLSQDARALLDSLRPIAGLSSGRVDLETKTVTVGYCGSLADPGQIAAALQASGYQVSPVQPAAPEPSTPNGE